MAPRTLILTLLLVLPVQQRPASAQTITEFPLPTQHSGLSRITAGGDGNLWFTESIYDSSIGVTTPASIGPITTTGSVTEFECLGCFAMVREEV